MRIVFRVGHVGLSFVNLLDNKFSIPSERNRGFSFLIMASNRYRYASGAVSGARAP